MNNKKGLEMKSKILGLLAVGLLTGPLSANADIILGGQMWRQVTDTLNAPYSSVYEACVTEADPFNGTCTGSVGIAPGQTVDLTGWTWAGRDEIVALFEALILPDSVQFSDAYGRYETPYTSSAVANAFNTFNATSEARDQAGQLLSRSLVGYIREPYITSNLICGFETRCGYSPYLFDEVVPIQGEEVFAVDIASLGEARETVVSSSIGYWMYTSYVLPPPPHEAPEPGTLALLGIGLAGALWRFGWKAHLQANSEA